MIPFLFLIVIALFYLFYRSLNSAQKKGIKDLFKNLLQGKDNKEPDNESSCDTQGSENSSPTSDIVCSTCGTKLLPTMSYCWNCGVSVSLEPDLHCQDCGFLVKDPNAIYCFNCGEKIGTHTAKIQINIEDLGADIATQYCQVKIKSIKNDGFFSPDISYYDRLMKILYRLEELDMLSPALCKNFADMAYSIEEYYTAVEFYEKAMELDPNLDYTKQVDRALKKA